MTLVNWVGPVTMMYIVTIVNLKSVLENTIKLIYSCRVYK